MEKHSKKEIKNTIKASIDKAIADLNISKTSKKTAGLIDKFSKKIADQLKEALKKQGKKLNKVKRESKPKVSKPIAA